MTIVLTGILKASFGLHRNLVLFLVAAFLPVLPVAAQHAPLDSLLRIVADGNDSARIQSLNELSWYYKNIRVDSAVLLARQALSLATRISDKAGISKSLSNLGSAKQAMGEYDSAILFIKQAIDVKLTWSDSSALANELSNLGIIYDERGDYDKALRSYFKALRLARAKGDIRMEANTLSNIGVVYKKQKQYAKVLEYYQVALSIYEQLKSEFGITVTSGNIGSIMLQTGDYEESLKYSRIAKDGYERLGYIRYIPYSIGNMAIANDSLHRFREAEEQYNEAFTRHMRFGNRYEAAYTCKNLAAFYQRQHSPVRAKTFASQAIQLATDIGAKEMLRDAFFVMSTICNDLGQFREAYLNQMKYTALKDSLFEELKTKSILEMQVKYETETRELEISKQKVQLAANDLELRNRRNQFIWLSSGSILLIIAGAFVIQGQRTRRKKAEQEAEFRLKLATLERENEVQQVRQRISRELHDNIGSRLLFLTSSADSLADKVEGVERERAHQMGSFARTTLQELRRTVWFINQDNIDLEALQTKMREYFGFLHQDPVVQLDHALEADPGITVGTSVAAAIFRVAQEAVSNALKHSRASRIAVKLTSEKEWIELHVHDDGKGFDATESARKQGNGLRNMDSYAELAAGSLTVHSSTEGTTVTLRIPIKAQGE